MNQPVLSACDDEGGSGARPRGLAEAGLAAGGVRFGLGGGALSAGRCS